MDKNEQELKEFLDVATRERKRTDPNRTELEPTF